MPAGEGEGDSGGAEAFSDDSMIIFDGLRQGESGGWLGLFLLRNYHQAYFSAIWSQFNIAVKIEKALGAVSSRIVAIVAHRCRVYSFDGCREGNHQFIAVVIDRIQLYPLYNHFLFSIYPLCNHPLVLRKRIV